MEDDTRSSLCPLLALIPTPTSKMVTVQISPAAAREIKRLQASRLKTNSRLRLSIKQGGCSGFLYALEIDQNLEEDSASISESQGISIIVDQESELWLQDFNLDYSEDLMGGAFRFHNGKAKTTCSCGQSFAID
jgi:iron-sulfur cluster assembly protein